jgi:SAM-dependent methyltransferase
MTIYPEYSKFHLSTNPEKSKLIKSYINPGKILDIGCGNGLYALDCSPEVNEIIQLDIIDRRSEIVKNLKFIKDDVEKYEMDPCSLDTIIAFDIIEHLNDDQKFINKAYNQLKIGGRILISVPNEDNSILEKVNLAHIHFTDKTHRREYTNDKLKKLLESNGFNVIIILPHFNSAIINFTDLLSKDFLLSKIASFCLKFTIKFFIYVGLFQNKIIADWFIVAEKQN